MCEDNQTQVTQIRMLGFQGLYKFKILLFIVFLVTYIMILTGNLLIIILVTTIDYLKVPMFFFLKHLAIADMLLTTSVVPMMLENILLEEGRLSFIGCLTQLYCFGIFGFVQCFLIAVMSYDRFLAICNPLRYTLMMGPNVCLQLVIGSWLLVIILITSGMVIVFQINFCGLSYIDHFFCDFGPTVNLATSDTSMLMLQDFVVSIFMIFFPFAFIIMTYICIFFTIVKMSSNHRRRKAFSTCSSHLTIVCTYYGTLITVYMTPSNESTSHINKYRSLLYIMATPLMNPIIYSLRNRKIKKALIKLLNNFWTVSWKRSK
ncbi:olfactory receptor 11A1-like [Mixophyes fleayi]|uniref:olfactory receptor 11A1-like n=1 Tax=Mixophyes fleayi TaxID=3061075 RepID=UPI003F4E414D